MKYTLSRGARPPVGHALSGCPEGYTYTYRMTNLEMWQLSMYHIYGSMVGVCNIIFTVAVLALAISRWSTSGMAFRIFLILGIGLFTVIQPMAVYWRARRQAAAATEDTTVCFSDRGLHVEVGEQSSDIPWTSIRRISRKPTMMILFSDTTHGFVLTDRVLGKEREELYDYAAARINKSA